MLRAEKFVDEMLRVSNPKRRMRNPQILPTEDCPLPDFTDDLTDEEWVMLCHLVNKPSAQWLVKGMAGEK